MFISKKNFNSLVDKVCQLERDYATLVESVHALKSYVKEDNSRDNELEVRVGKIEQSLQNKVSKQKSKRVDKE